MAATVARIERMPRFVHALRYEDLPSDVLAQARRCLLDLVGTAAAGSRTQCARIAADHATRYMASGDASGSRMLFDGRCSGIPGAAYAGATTIDACDAHDGHVLCKGHVGVAVLPAILAFADAGRAFGGAGRAFADKARANVGAGHTIPRAGKTTVGANDTVDDRELIVALVLGYEIGTRAGIAQHASVADYHCSGSWNAIAAAAVGARLLGLDPAKTREAIGIAEYFGPRGQMMRVCDRPSMLKDGSGWGAHAGATAALLARDGFTGAPAVVVEHEEADRHWSDLGSRWRIREQYFKAYPVCRWAQPAIEAALSLQRAHRFDAGDVESIMVESFREAVVLGAACSIPRTTEDAQYSLTHPVAAALVFGDVGPAEIEEPLLSDARVQRLLRSMELVEDPAFSAQFPAERWARVRIRLKNGEVLSSQPAIARGNPENPLADDEIAAKFEHYARPVLGDARTTRIAQAIERLGEGTAAILFDEILGGSDESR